MKKTFAVLLVLVMMLALSVTASAAGRLTPDEAKQAALDYVGVDASNADFTKLKRDWDDGREVYEIEFYADGTQYEMDIDALTGRVKDFSAEYHDAGRLSDGDNETDLYACCLPGQPGRCRNQPCHPLQSHRGQRSFCMGDRLPLSGSEGECVGDEHCRF